MFGHFEPVNHCCFSPNDTYLSTSSNDGTVKVSTICRFLCLSNMVVESETFNTEALSCLQLTNHPLPFYFEMSCITLDVLRIHTFNLCVHSFSKWHLPTSGSRSTSGACWQRETKTYLSSAAPGPATANTSFVEAGMLCWSVFLLGEEGEGVSR